jgi:hypothetical protein
MRTKTTIACATAALAAGSIFYGLRQNPKDVVIPAYAATIAGMVGFLGGKDLTTLVSQKIDTMNIRKSLRKEREEIEDES